MYKKLIAKTLLVIALSFPVFAHAQDESYKEEDIDLEYRLCKLKDSSVSNICDCAFIAYDKWNKQLDAAEKRLDKLLKEENRLQLKKSDTSWMAYKDQEFTLFDYIYSKQGNYWCTLRQDSRIDVIKTRTIQLRNYFEAIRIGDEKRLLEKK